MLNTNVCIAVISISLHVGWISNK